MILLRFYGHCAVAFGTLGLLFWTTDGRVALHQVLPDPSPKLCGCDDPAAPVALVVSAVAYGSVRTALHYWFAGDD